MAQHKFNNKVAIVTGAGRGIGFEIARQLSRSGAAVALNDIDADLAQKACDYLIKAGGRTICVAGDSGNLEIIEELCTLTIDKFGRIDYAVANSGITTFGSFLKYEVSEFRRLIDVNLQGSFFLAQRVAKQLIKQQSQGSILFMSSVTGHQAHPNLAAYGMSKAALEMLAKILGVELAPYGITVNTVAPGATLTERTQTDKKYEETWKRLTPTGNVNTPSDIANAALFLLSESSRQITGQSLVVDGGWTSLSPPP